MLVDKIILQDQNLPELTPRSLGILITHDNSATTLANWKSLSGCSLPSLSFAPSTTNGFDTQKGGLSPFLSPRVACVNERERERERKSMATTKKDIIRTLRAREGEGTIALPLVGGLFMALCHTHSINSTSGIFWHCQVSGNSKSVTISDDQCFRLFSFSKIIFWIFLKESGHELIKF